jgi:hypothetical protein
MFTLCFFAFQWTGEMSTTSLKSVKNIILIENLIIDELIKMSQYMALTLRHSSMCLQMELQKSCKSNSQVTENRGCL